TSVRTDRQAAPWAAYEAAISAGLKFSRITPLEGEAFLISAITPGLPWAIFSSIARAKPRTSFRLLASRSTSDSLRIWRAAEISAFLVARIFCSMSFIGILRCRPNGQRSASTPGRLSLLCKESEDNPAILRLGSVVKFLRKGSEIFKLGAGGSACDGFERHI